MIPPTMGCYRPNVLHPYVKYVNDIASGCTGLYCAVRSASGGVCQRLPQLSFNDRSDTVSGKSSAV